MSTQVLQHRRQNHSGFTLTELLVSIAILGVLSSMMLPGLTRALESARRAVCASNLRQVGMGLMMYADESDGLFPPLQEVGDPPCLPGPVPPLMLRGRAMYPEYITDPRILICPSDLRGKEEYAAGRWRETGVSGHPGPRPSILPCRIDDLSYHYIPWLFRAEWIMDDATMDFSTDFYGAFLDTLEYAGQPNSSSREWSFADASGRRHHVFPLRQGVERVLITDINAPWRGHSSASDIPIMFDHLSTNPLYFNHLPGGANILYMDGHVDFAKYPQRDPYPVTRAWAMLVTSLDSENGLLDDSSGY